MVERIFNVKQVAEILGVSIATVNRLLNTGKLKKIYVSERRVGVRESDLQKYIDSLSGDSE
jgi:excisionase family DNA binding protein